MLCGVLEGSGESAGFDCQTPRHQARTDDAARRFESDLPRGLTISFWLRRPSSAGVTDASAVQQCPLRPPTGAAVNSDLFLDETAGLVVRCTGGDRYAVRGWGLREESFYVARYGVLINASFSGADLTDAREIKRELETILTSFVIQDTRAAERATR